MLGVGTAGQAGRGRGGPGAGRARTGAGYPLGFFSPEVRGETPHEVVLAVLQLQRLSALDVADEPALLPSLHLIGAWRGASAKLSPGKGREEGGVQAERWGAVSDLT